MLLFAALYLLYLATVCIIFAVFDNLINMIADLWYNAVNQISYLAIGANAQSNRNKRKDRKARDTSNGIARLFYLPRGEHDG